MMMAEVIFWLSALLIIYVYVGYPVILWLLAAHVGEGARPSDAHRPTVSLLIAAYNEEKVLAEKLENSLLLEYPREKLEILVASDGSSDGTNEIARRYAGRGVVLHEIVPRGGKARALNLALPHTTGEIIVFSDANAMYQPDAVRKLIGHFVAPEVGAVSGDVRLVNAADSHAASEGLYYRYERWLQSLESSIGRLIGADGAMYAVRRRFLVPASNGTILDDFVISMNVAREGGRVLYDPEAVAFEEGTRTSREEFRRKARIVAGGVQALRRGEGLPRRDQPLLVFCYVSHKALRWLLGIFLLSLWLTSGILAGNVFYRIAFLGQLAFYGAGAAYGMGWLNGVSLLGIPFYFTLVNVAAIVGLWRGVRDAQPATWRTSTR